MVLVTHGRVGFLMSQRASAVVACFPFLPTTQPASGFILHLHPQAFAQPTLPGQVSTVSYFNADGYCVYPHLL